VNAELSIVDIHSEHSDALGTFFADLRRNGDETEFHPHPLTASEARRITAEHGQDIYRALLADDGAVVGYGILRGWDDGFDTPSLGVAVHPSLRGQGQGRRLVLDLHEVARARGAAQVRLTVSETNSLAIALYVSVGYRLSPHHHGTLVGVVDL
jgi:ribosomal protein S18 acetylase RimI-like enzyme